LRLITTFILILCVALTTLADMKIRVRITSGGTVSREQVIYLKGLRQREEIIFANDARWMAIITQCDLRREIVVRSFLKTYTLETFDEIDANLARYEAEQKKKMRAPRPGKGGAIKYTYTVTDTGERREMFGFTARRIKSTILVEPAPEACHKYGYRIEMDGWYVDLLYDLRCSKNLSGASLYPDPFSGQESYGMPFMTGSKISEMRRGCKDSDDWSDYRKNVAARLGFPLQLTSTMYDQSLGWKPYVETREVVQLSQDGLDASLFDVPAGYAQAPVQYVLK
jgi:hypothetical protein